MGGAPYLYQRPSTYSFSGPTDRGFNPKAASHASWSPQQPRPTPTGPLIDSKEMNRHPDSYFVVPYGNLNWKPMSGNTKKVVKWVRFLQLFLRICALLGAAGLLVCVICIKPTGNSTDWIMRVPPGVAILHTVYAIYHLSRSSKDRTPASSASYHIFSSIMDAGLVPFLAFTALIAHKESLEPIDSEGHWNTLFGTDFATKSIVQSTWLIAVTTGGIHVASLCVSVYLALRFRKISQLPPDMNPLEDNLTSRSHKRNKSSMSVAVTESTMTNRDSHLSAPLMDSPSNRAVPFMHTRNESTTSLGSPQRQSMAASNRNSRTDLPSQVYYQPESQRSSRNDLRRSPERSAPKRSSALAQSTSTPPSRPSSTHISPQRESLLKEPAAENWFVHASSPPSSPENESSAAQFDEAPPEFQHLRVANTSSPTAKSSSNRYDFTNRSPRPLEMNPPTPPVNSTFRQNRERFEQRALQNTAGNNGSVNGSPATWEEQNYVAADKTDGDNVGYGSGAKGKSRFYGNLKDSLRVGRRGQRVVSSGVDVEGPQHGRGLRGREVSGKVAEEGRAY